MALTLERWPPQEHPGVVRGSELLVEPEDLPVLR
jgi:hypothetical protein